MLRNPQDPGSNTLLIDLTALSEPLARGDLVLTANNRLRNQILRAYAASQSGTVWQSPPVQALNQWIVDHWRRLQDLGYPDSAYLIANDLQRQLLWEDIIAASPLAHGLLRIEELAQSADNAWRNLQLWGLTAAEISREDNPNTSAFLAWLAEFEKQMHRRGFITAERSQEIISQAFARGDLPRYPRVYLYGFDDLPPLHRQLLERGCDQLIDLPPALIADAHRQRVEAGSDEAEMRAAALWSQAQLQQNPSAVIGIIVPNLGQCRARVERIFTEVFEPRWFLPHTPRYTLPFNFSAGTPLATTPLVQTALALLNLNHRQVELEALCQLLVSPFFGDADNEVVPRSFLQERLRRTGKFQLDLNDIAYHSETLGQALGSTDGTGFARRWLTLENDRRAMAGKHSANYWAGLFQDQLNRLGWPGARRLDSQEYQQMALWQKVLAEFCSLDAADALLDLTSALTYLRRLAGTTPFQTQTPQSPIQILGALEGAGLRFSHCWIMGLHHRQWPPAPAPHPLLPVSVQRRHNMPHASAERELLFAQSLTRNYRACAGQIVISSAHSDGEHDLRPSALIRDLPLTPLSDLPGQNDHPLQDFSQALRASQQLDLVHTAQGPALANTGTSVRGGSSLIKAQAACPFAAFAQWRLGAHPLPSPTPGFSAQERGTSLHNALAILWQRLGTAENLLTLAAEALEALLKHAAAEALKPLQQKRQKELGTLYCQLEQERLAQLLKHWLALEQNRPPFSVIAIEEDREILFAGLPLRLRIDRIDQTADGQVLLIDYKTGTASSKSWQGERPDEPQLPLYAITLDREVAAIAFAQINAKAMGWIGLGELNHFHEGISRPDSWNDQLREWREQLGKLAEAFKAGDARVDFKNIKAANYAAHLQALTRIAEADLMADYLQRGPIRAEARRNG